MKIFQMQAVFARCLVLLLAGVATAASAGHHEDEPDSIVEVAEAAGDFKTLVAAIDAADLTATLQGDGPFTVFAPTDEAFAKLPAGTVEELLKPENRDRLVAVLTYHVVPGKVMAGDVVKLDSAPTVNGEAVRISVADSQVRVNQAVVVAADIPARNGVIHVVDEVILPPAG